ncbi:MAG: NUDIX hydrolase [Ruminococcus sp.]|uniref:NUDIX domain-containing protein n=1 Tax=Ruminococcus sp. TaxID=41978 RepID=UPI0025E99B87|nr:NUDIX hydrolase [Ruminococcus sp.]MBO4865356.1 NUDIX hydrolase [Ruminococcus sp.]
MSTESEKENDWGKSAAAVVLKDGKVLLVRHTYGAGKGLLIIPGGYIRKGELPDAACEREVHEETGVTVKAEKLIGIRFSEKDWYSVFTASYISGEARSDNEENSEAVWIDAYEAVERDDVPDLTKSMIRSALKGTGFVQTDFVSREKETVKKLYTI